MHTESINLLQYSGVSSCFSGVISDFKASLLVKAHLEWLLLQQGKLRLLRWLVTVLSGLILQILSHFFLMGGELQWFHRVWHYFLKIRLARDPFDAALQVWRGGRRRWWGSCSAGDLLFLEWVVVVVEFVGRGSERRQVLVQLEPDLGRFDRSQAWVACVGRGD